MQERGERPPPTERLSNEALAGQAEAMMEAQRCHHKVLHEIDGMDAWYRCQWCGDIMELPVTMIAHPPSDVRRMLHWLTLELERWPDGHNPSGPPPYLLLVGP